MIASGIPERRSDHALVLADAALEIQAIAARYRRDDGELVALRIGMASGTVVAGVIGRRKFLYDLWMPHSGPFPRARRVARSRSKVQG